MLLRYAAAALCAYLLGSISSSVIISKRLYGTDVRSSGSGNAGATNMARVYGMGPGLAVLACDVVKTLLSCWIGSLLAGRTGVCIAGVLCNIGHCYPVFFNFSGGKGVSVGGAIAAVLGWKVLLASLAVFFLVFFLTHIVSVCSVTVAVLMPLLCLLFGGSRADIILACSVTVIVVLRHRGNIRRLLRGEEGKFSPNKKEKEK